MRRTLLVLCLPALLAACASRRDPDDLRIMTTAEANRDSLQGAMSAPLRDINIIRTKVPPVLLEAMPDPYARPLTTDCQTLVSLVKPLNDVMGPDLDLIPPKEDEDLVDRGKAWGADAALGAVAGAASDVIPFRGWVRRLSGAEKHDRLVQAALAAGAVRRAYLKGLGEARGCEPPATPDHSRSSLPPVSQNDRFLPRFPIRWGGEDTPATQSEAPSAGPQD